MEFTRTIDNALYTRKALADARDAYRDYCVVKTVPRSDGLADITVTVKDEYCADARQVTLEFWNYFLDTVCKQRLESG
jgi:hypothetical protein